MCVCDYMCKWTFRCVRKRGKNGDKTGITYRINFCRGRRGNAETESKAASWKARRIESLWKQ